jgi:SAM-dependent methyltransferase
MDAQKQLREVLAKNRAVRLIEDDIYSVLPDTSRKHHYDRRATIYDSLVSTRLYNSVMWGSSPLDYIDFARQAVTSCPEGRFLDAGCGSLLFTAPIYLNCRRQIIAFDQSVAMLRRGRKRLLKLAGSMPAHIILLQADLSDLPFPPASFRTVLCLNVLHQFKEAAALIPNLKKLLTNDGYLFLTSLVVNNRFIGDYYLRALYLTNEFVRPRSRLQLQEIMKESPNQEMSLRVKGNMAFVTTKG